MLAMDTHKSINKNEPQAEVLRPFLLKDLLESRNIDWTWINKTFRNSPAAFEEVLFRIHYKRKKLLPGESVSRILLFLSTGYLSTNDIRYFNEFLWFYKETEHEKEMMDGCMERFHASLDEKGCHHLPESLVQYPVNTAGRDLDSITVINNSPLKVCLIGFPPFFGPVIKQLKKEGHQVHQYFIPYHPNRYINRLLKFKLPVKLLSMLKGNFYTYKTLNYDPRDEQIGKELKKEKFDIGFHKLNLIIRENIFGSFRLGLLNDHWGYLPLMRGKSTIAYSLLLDVPVISTIHFINEGIDSGPIVGYQMAQYSNAASADDVRGILKKKMPQRVVAAIKFAGSNNFTSKENNKEAGATFYEMHPWLNEHINSRILKKK
ncbi:MAG TPA: formyltransferase family protein [Ferruginibacter sp.]|nr:formyltransferase family protein [Ferruginibacter sp.]